MRILSLICGININAVAQEAYTYQANEVYGKYIDCRMTLPKAGRADFSDHFKNRKALVHKLTSKKNTKNGIVYYIR